MDFLDPQIDQYAQNNSEKEPDILYKLYRETWQKVLNPRMLAGHLQGRVISMLSHMIQPEKVLEIGTFTGYSAICWAEGLKEDGMIHTIDINEELETMVSKYIQETGFSNNIKQHIGNAIEIIPQLNEKWDVVFLDADKSNYLNYLDLVIDQVNPGGYIVADNVLWSGKVLNPEENTDPDTLTLIEYTKKVNADPRLQTVLFPIRDGLLISRKK